jgi:hypothetical protein
MEEFIKELNALLEKHSATIVRSASENHELVICILTYENAMKKEIEATFDEEIGTTHIKNKWYTVQTYFGR